MRWVSWGFGSCMGLLGRIQGCSVGRVGTWYTYLVGLATVNRIRCTYGNRITVPVTVPAVAMGACSRTRYTDSGWPSITVYWTAVYGQCTGVRVPIILVGFSIFTGFLSKPVLFGHNEKNSTLGA